MTAGSASQNDSEHTARGADRRLERLERLAHGLDGRFSLFGIRFGWDAILGLIPGVGDAVTTASGAYIILEGARMGARRSVLARMAVNSGLDFVIGGIPLIGDAFDVAFKANRRNIALLKREMAAQSDLAQPTGPARHRTGSPASTVHDVGSVRRG